MYPRDGRGAGAGVEVVIDLRGTSGVAWLKSVIWVASVLETLYSWAGPGLTRLHLWGVASVAGTTSTLVLTLSMV